jgi:hypothetical protein
MDGENGHLPNLDSIEFEKDKGTKKGIERSTQDDVPFTFIMFFHELIILLFGLSVIMSLGMAFPLFLLL